MTRTARSVKSWLNGQLPKRKTVVRAALCGAIATMPMMFAVLVQRWYVALPFFAAIGTGLYYSGFTEDFLKQLRWMRRMSERGPVFKLARFVRRQYVRAKRRCRCSVRTSLPAPLVPRVLRFGPKSKYKLELFCRDLSNEHRHI